MAFKCLLWSFSWDKQPSYKHFLAVGAFSHKFSMAPIAEILLIASKKLGGGYKNGMDLLYHHAKYGGDPGSRAGCRRKSVMFFCLSVFFITLSNDEVCDNGNAMKQYNFQNNYGVIA